MNIWALVVGVFTAAILYFGLAPWSSTVDAEVMLQPSYKKLETGVARLPDGTLRVSALTRMPGVEARMVRWWFADFMTTTEHYKKWHPRDHVWMDWENKSPGEAVGASHLVHEYIGGELNKLRIQFVDPTEFFDVDPNDDHTFVICARVGLLDQPINLGLMCHMVRDTEFGAEMQSRFWLGHVAAREGNETKMSAAGLIGNAAIVRRFAVSEESGIALLKHCIEEMGFLADFLPDLYAAETAKK